MPAPVRRAQNLAVGKLAASSQRTWLPDPMTAGALLLMVACAFGIGGWLWAGMAVGGSLAFLRWAQQNALKADTARMQQENLQHFLVQGANPEELAKIRAGGELMSKNLDEFLNALKETYGGESMRGTGRLASEEQTEAVAPGITFTLSHDLGWWYAKLVLSGETSRQFLQGGFTQWKGRGHTPQEAIDAVIKRCGAARQQKMIQEYAAKLVGEDD